MSSTYDAEEAQEWIDRVHSVKKAIEDLGNGKEGALKNADVLLNKMNKNKNKIKHNNNNNNNKKNNNKINEKEKIKFRKGDGYKNEYKYYCNNCFTEILINNINKCPRCKYNKLITRKERRLILENRVNKLMSEYHEKEIRRKRWEEYRKLHGKNEYNLTNYKEWELWEDEIDWNDYMDDNYIPCDNIAAKQMAFDMKERSEKRKKEMKAAIYEKNEGNKYLKQGKYSLAIQHYSSAINYRRDYKALYTNRALAYMKLARYDKCINDCSIVIDMIQYIDKHEIKSDIIFKAYLRRSNAYQLLGNLKNAKKDIINAINLRPKQKDAIKLNKTIDLLISDENIRNEITKKILNKDGKTSINFDNALKLTLEYFQRSENHTIIIKDNDILCDKTPLDKKIEKWKSENPSLLFDKLLNIISTKHEYAIKFADENGLYFGFKYLESELLILQNEMSEIDNSLEEYSPIPMNQMKINLNIKQLTLSKLCKLLIYICQYQYNKLKLSRNKKLISTISNCIYYILSSFEQYIDLLSINSVHLTSICCEINEIRDFICNNPTYSKLFYKNINEYLLYSPPNNNKLQILQYLFDFLENLFGNQLFIKISIKIYFENNLKLNQYDDDVQESIMQNPHIYVALFNHLQKYCDYVHSAKMGQEEMMKFEIKQSVVSSILTALATLFGPNKCIIKILYKDQLLKQRILCLKQHLISLNRMFIQFEEKNPLKNINNLPKSICGQYLKQNTNQTQQVLNKLYEKHQLNISQITKVITVFMSLSHHQILHKILISLKIHNVFFDLLPYLKYIDYKNIQYSNILSLARDHIINYFDQISNNPQFDIIIDQYNKTHSDCGDSDDPLPPFWSFITSIITRRSFIKTKDDEKSNGSKTSQSSNNNNDDNQQQNYDDMEVDAQSGCIRIITRWIRRRLPDDKKKDNLSLDNNENNDDNEDDDDDDDDDDVIDIVRDEQKKNSKRNNGNYSNRGTDQENGIIDILLTKHYNNIFKYIKYCDDPHVLANAPLLLKQFIIYAKLNEKNKPFLKKLIKKHSKKKLKDLMALFTNQHVSIIQNSVTCMAQLATFDEDLRDKIREMGGLKAMSQLHLRHRQSLFK